MTPKEVYIPVPVEENKPATNPATNNGITERSDEVIFYDETLGWNVGWRKLFTANSSDTLFPEQVKGYSIFENVGGKFRHVTHYLEKKELFVLTKEELKDFAEQARRYTLNNAQHVGVAVYVMGSTDDFFNDWLNTQK